MSLSTLNRRRTTALVKLDSESGTVVDESSNSTDTLNWFQQFLQYLKQVFVLGKQFFQTIGSIVCKFFGYFGTQLKSLLENQKFWKYAKLIPIINTIFGTPKCIYHLIRQEWAEAGKVGLYMVGGLAAIFIPLYFGVGCLMAFFLGSAINNLIGGIGGFIVDLCNNEDLRNAHWSDMEDYLYKEVIKVTPLIAIGYCPFRAAVYRYRGDKRKAKVTLKDWIVNGVSVLIALIALQFFDCSKLLDLIEENIGSIQNAFAKTVLRVIQKVMINPIFQRVAAQGINVVPHGVRDSIFKEAGFPYFVVDHGKFFDCLQNQQLLKDNWDQPYMAKECIQYITKCLFAGFKDTVKDNKLVIELAFQGRNTSVLQTVAAFSPTVLNSKGQRFKSIRDRMLNEIDPSFNCVVFILKCCLDGSENGEVCCGIHDVHRIISAEPIIHRPTQVIIRDNKRILCLDGGGTKGLVIIELLKQIELVCNDKINTLFDVIVGTSTGGLLALLLADGHTVDEIQKFYFQLKDGVFSGRKGNLTNFENILVEYFGDKVMNQIPNSINLIITATKLNGKQMERTFFTNYDESSGSVPIRDVARATAAAPGSFPPFIINGSTYVDGGLTCNNPVMAAFHKFRDEKMDNYTIVSLGSGISQTAESNKKLRISRSFPGQVRMAVDGSLGHFVEILINRATDTDGDFIQDCLMICERSNAFFYRLNPIFPFKIELDETDDAKLVNAIWHTKAFAVNNKSIFEELNDRLLNN